MFYCLKRQRARVDVIVDLRALLFFACSLLGSDLALTSPVVVLDMVSSLGHGGDGVEDYHRDEAGEADGEGQRDQRTSLRDQKRHKCREHPVGHNGEDEGVPELGGAELLRHGVVAALDRGQLHEQR